MVKLGQFVVTGRSISLTLDPKPPYSLILLLTRHPADSYPGVMQERANNRTNRAVAMILAAVAISGVFGTIAHADEPVTTEPVTTEVIVAVGLPPIPPTTVIVAVGLPPIPPTTVIVAVGLPPIPPVDDVAAQAPMPPVAVDDVAVQAPVPQASIELPETGASIMTVVAATVLTTVGAALAAISRRVL